MVHFKRPEHQAVAAALRAMDHDLLMRCACWFGRGTEIVLDLGEYRLSKDIDFLCADADGYREMRSLAVSRGTSALFGGDVSGRSRATSTASGALFPSRTFRSGSRLSGRAASASKDARTGNWAFRGCSPPIESPKRCSRMPTAPMTDRRRIGTRSTWECWLSIVVLFRTLPC